MKVLHYNNSFKSDPLHQLLSDFGESATDTTTWRPELSIIHSQAQGASSKRFLYDFPDGKDNGERVQTFIRNKGLDVTEIDNALNTVAESTENKVAEAKKKLKDKEDSKKEQAENIKALGDSVASAINGTSAEGTTSN